MQQALSYRVWLPGKADSPMGRPASALEDGMNVGGVGEGGGGVKSMVSENAVIVFGRRGCCMCHVVKRLLLGLGVNPVVYEVDESEEVGVVDELGKIGGVEGNDDGRPQFPALFIGGRLFGGLDRLMAAHISGELIPILKQAGALWL